MVIGHITFTYITDQELTVQTVSIALILPSLRTLAAENVEDNDGGSPHPERRSSKRSSVSPWS